MTDIDNSSSRIRENPVLSHWGIHTVLASYVMLACAPILAFGSHQGYSLSIELIVVVGSIAILAIVFSLVVVLLPSWVNPVFQVIAAALLLEYFSGLSLKVSLVACVIALAIFRTRSSFVIAASLGAFNLASIAVWSANGPGFVAENPDNGVELSESSAPVIHLILDAQIGLEGTPDIDGKKAIRDLNELLLKKEFVVYGRAFSQYPDTRNSLANLFNFASSETIHDYSLDRPSDDIVDASKLTENRYIDYLHSLGKRVYAYQTDYLDLCTGSSHAPYYCRTYSSNYLRALQTSEIPWNEKAKYLWGSFLGSSYRAQWVRKNYQMLRSMVPGMQRLFPAWHHQPYLTTSITTLSTLRDLENRISSMQNSDVVIGHLMLPHSPYSLNAVCEIRKNASTWLWSHNFTLNDGRKNTSESRAIRYKQYFDQVSCLIHQLNRLFDTIDNVAALNDATVIIHGDHGARIQEYLPEENRNDVFDRDDLRDTFSTLFAVRKHGRAAEYVEEPIRLQLALSEAVGYPLKKSTADHTLMLYSGRPGAVFIKVQMNLFD